MKIEDFIDDEKSIEDYTDEEIALIKYTLMKGFDLYCKFIDEVDSDTLNIDELSDNIQIISDVILIVINEGTGPRRFSNDSFNHNDYDDIPDLALMLSEYSLVLVSKIKEEKNEDN
jgi:hypothetical protein